MLALFSRIRSHYYGLHQPQVFARNTPAAPLELPQLRRLAWNTPSISPNLLRFIATPMLQTLHVVFKTFERDQNLSHFIPESLVQLSKSSPVLLHAYHPFTSTFGINLYADSAHENKLFAFSLRNVYAGGPLGARNFEAFFEMFFEAFLKAHKLLSLRSTMLTDISVDLVRNVYRLIPEMNVKDEDIGTCTI